MESALRPHTKLIWRVKEVMCVSELYHNTFKQFSITSRDDADEYEQQHSCKIADKDNWRTIAQHISHKDDADFIVMCCNNHDALLDALKETLPAYEYIMYTTKKKSEKAELQRRLTAIKNTIQVAQGFKP